MKKVAVAVFLFMIGCGGDGGTPGDVIDTSDTGADGYEEADVVVECDGPDDCKGFPAGPCRVAVCNAQTGLCATVADPDMEGAECEPDDLCAIEPKVCNSGECVYTKKKTCDDRPCHDTLGCAPDTGKCEYEALPDDTACNHPDPCMLGSCKGGACAGSQMCDDGDACTLDTCDQGTGSCTHDDTDCDDGDQCTVDSCDPISGCLHQVDEDAACEDGDLCTIGEACDAEGECKGGGPTVCNDENECTDDSCDSFSGCVNEPLVGKACEDGDLCTYGEKCDSEGLCAGGEPKDCIDDNPCTDDSCDQDDGECVYAKNTALCDDGDQCTDGDVCSGGGCQPGDPVFGCCLDDPDCTDNDPCTVESCVDDACVYAGEPAGASGAGCAKAEGLDAGFCNTDSGACDAFGLDLPRVLLDWDLTSGDEPNGFRWASQGGTLGPDGASPVKDIAASFLLPGHWVPAGVKVVYLYLGQGQSCDDSGLVGVSQGGEELLSGGCVVHEGRAVVPFAWADQAEVRLDTAIAIGPGAIVSRLTLYAWAAFDKRPLGPVEAAPGANLSDLSLAGNSLGMLAGYRHDLKTETSGFAFKTGSIAVSQTSNENFTMGPGGFDTSLITLPDGRYLLAYGGADQEVRVVLLDAGGNKVHEAIPDLFDPVTDGQFEPCLSRAPGGPILLAYASTEIDKDGLGVALTEVSVTGDQVGPFGEVEAVDPGASGDQRMPALWQAGPGANGAVVWVTDLGIEAGKAVRIKRLTPGGSPIGAGATLATTEEDDPFERLAVTGAQGRMFVVWQTANGDMGGRVLNSDLQDVGDVGFDSVGDKFYFPSMTSSENGALVILARVLDMDVNMVQLLIGPDGTTGTPVPLSTHVEKATASNGVSSCGPFVDCYGYVDTWSADTGLRLGLTSGSCADGPVNCTDTGSPGVCVGFGDTGYVHMADADWCGD